MKIINILLFILRILLQIDTTINTMLTKQILTRTKQFNAVVLAAKYRIYKIPISRTDELNKTFNYPNNGVFA